MIWRDVKPGDRVFHGRKQKTVLSASLGANIWDYEDTREYVHLWFVGTEPWDRNGDGEYQELGAKKVTPCD